ncbi:MAG: heavy-metal-associated domain-containing protein, partial [Nitrososphaera sp.]
PYSKRSYWKSSWTVERIAKEAIKSMDIDFMTDSVIVEYNPTLVTKERIKERLQNSGYKFVRVSR